MQLVLYAAAQKNRPQSAEKADCRCTCSRGWGQSVSMLKRLGRRTAWLHAPAPHGPGEARMEVVPACGPEDGMRCR